MLTLLIGRAGTGKSHTIFTRVCAQGADRRVLVVPEQFSHETERRLCQVGGAEICLYAEVLSFSRLAGRIFAHVGGLAAPVLDAGGRILLMYNAVRQVAGHLTVYQRPSRKPAFLTGLIDTMDECKRYCISPDDLLGAAEQLQGMERDKLRDLGLIFGAYDALCANIAADPRDRLTRAAQLLAEHSWGADTAFFFDSFTEFSPQEHAVIRALLRRGAHVTVALTCDSLRTEAAGRESDIFAPARRTAAVLRRMAGDAGVQCTIETCAEPRGKKAASLVHLEQNLFAETVQPWQGEPPALELCEAATPWEEAQWAAGRIRALLQQGGYRCRDIAVAVRDVDGYGEVLETVFRRYEIPLFLSRSSPILEKPILALVIAALETVAGGFARSDLMRYLKTGLTNVTLPQCDRLENYMLLWDVKGNRFTQKKDWTMHPRGYGLDMEPDDRAALDEINDIRRAAAEPLGILSQNRVGTAISQVKTLYAFLDAIGLRLRLEQRGQGLRASGALKLADEYAQLWEILVDSLEQCALLLGEQPMELHEFAGLLPLLLSQYEVGTIPVSLDRVTALAADRAAHRQVRVLFLLGADDGSLPMPTRTPGMLTDDDRMQLAQLGFELYPGLEEALTREMTTVYSVCSAPTEWLAVSWPGTGADGGVRRPSFLIGRLSLLYPSLRMVRGGWDELSYSAPIPALEYAGSLPAVRAALEQAGGFDLPLRRLDAARAMARGALSPEAVERLYGARVPLSSSRMKAYQACPFSYFMKYGLRAKPRERAGLGALEYGTFLHLVLQRVIARRQCDGFDTEALVDEAIADYIATVLGGMEDKTPRFRYLFTRLRQTILLVVQNVLDELDSGMFQPIDFELGFGPGRALPPVEFTVGGVTVSVSGAVDRVDGWEHEGKLYLRVVDYKTGSNSFEPADLHAGIGLQLLLYLFALAREGGARYGKPVVPAGFLYLPARTVIVSGSPAMSEEARRREVDKLLVRRGLVLDDAQVIDAMETPRDGGYRFLPLKQKKAQEKLLVNAARLGKLSQFIDATLHEIGGGIINGSIAANPTWISPKENACRWCTFTAACQFEDGWGGDCKRWIPPMSAEDFWAQLDGEDGAQT